MKTSLLKLPKGTSKDAHQIVLDIKRFSSDEEVRLIAKAAALHVDCIAEVLSKMKTPSAKAAKETVESLREIYNWEDCEVAFLAMAKNWERGNHEEFA